jgi:predicted PurR-regulated permease PerM
MKPGFRKRLGLVIFVASFLHWGLIPIISFLDWSLEVKGLVATGVIVSAEGLLLLSLLLLGPEVVAQLNRVVKTALATLVGREPADSSKPKDDPSDKDGREP